MKNDKTWIFVTAILTGTGFTYLATGYHTAETGLKSFTAQAGTPVSVRSTRTLYRGNTPAPVQNNKKPVTETSCSFTCSRTGAEGKNGTPAAEPVIRPEIRTHHTLEAVPAAGQNNAPSRISPTLITRIPGHENRPVTSPVSTLPAAQTVQPGSDGSMSSTVVDGPQGHILPANTPPAAPAANPGQVPAGIIETKAPDQDETPVQVALAPTGNPAGLRDIPEQDLINDRLHDNAGEEPEEELVIAGLIDEKREESSRKVPDWNIPERKPVDVSAEESAEEAGDRAETEQESAEQTDDQADAEQEPSEETDDQTGTKQESSEEADNQADSEQDLADNDEASAPHSFRCKNGVCYRDDEPAAEPGDGSMELDNTPRQTPEAAQAAESDSPFSFSYSNHTLTVEGINGARVLVQVFNLHGQEVPITEQMSRRDKKYYGISAGIPGGMYLISVRGEKIRELSNFQID